MTATLDKGMFPCGKLNMNLLKDLMRNLPTGDARLVVGPRIGEDAAVIDFADRYLVATTDPITFATDEIGWYAVNINANDIVCRGATPKWFLATLLLPEGQADEAMARRVFDQIGSACRELEIAVAGGHTEVTYGISRPIVVGQMLGEVAKHKLVTTAGCQPGDDIVLTKGIAIEGTAIIAREKREQLVSRGYEPAWLATARDFLFRPGISVVREALIANGVAAVRAMHDPTEGGLATGLWELSLAAGVRMEIYAERIPILPESQRLCGEFGLDPLGTIASGALLIAVSPRDSQKVLEALHAAGIAAVAIGKATSKFGGQNEGNDAPNDAVMLVQDGTARPLPIFHADEITKIFA